MGSYTPTSDELDRLKSSFRHIKAEYDAELKKNIKELFVNTHEFFESQARGKSIIVGRKGSGKTALILGFEYNLKDNYKNIIKLDADELPLECLYNYFLKKHIQTTDEIGKLARAIGSEELFTELACHLDPTRLSTYAWQKAFQSMAIYISSEVLLQNGLCNNREHEVLNRVMHNIRGQLDDQDATAFLYALLTENYDEIRDLIEETINTFVGQAWGKLIALITNKITTKFKAPPSEDYKEALKIISNKTENSNWNILITFDRFDDFYDKHYQDLRNNKDDPEQSNIARRQILSAVLEGLILAVSAVKNDGNYRWTDLLVTVPMDKFMELNLRERARIEIENTIILQWTPPELFDYANRRIASALGSSIPYGELPWYHLFPETIENLSVKGSREDSFLYMLRHTLWKPREIQMYIQALLDRLYRGGITYKERENVFRQVIQEGSREIIRREFNPEFRKQYPRLWGLLGQFKSSKIYTVMELTDLMNSLNTSGLSSEITEKAEVLRRLYLMGVIGVRRRMPTKQINVEPTISQGRQEISYMFFFNSKDHDPFSGTTTIHVCFHPMFFDEIGAEHDKDYIVNEMRWDMFPDNGKNLLYSPNN